MEREEEEGDDHSGGGGHHDGPDKVAKTAANTRAPGSAPNRMLLLFSAADQSVAVHFPHEEGWREAMTTIRWSAEVTLRGWQTPMVGDTPSSSSTAGPTPTMKLLIAADCLPPSQSYVSPDHEEQTQSLQYYDELLKSAIQKAVRRRLAWPAVRLGYQLLMQSPDEFLRRLPVIMMEDGLPHHRLPFLVWLMVAHTKGWNLGLQQVLAVLQVVYELAACRWRDTIPYYSSDVPLPNPFTEEKVQHSVAKGLIASILLRACYGGMKGDIRFLRAFAHTWHRRFIHNPNEWESVLKQAYSQFKGNEVRMYYYSNRNPDEEPLSSKSYNEALDDSPQTDISILHPQDMLKEAVDMHCHPKIVDQLVECETIQRRGVASEQIRGAIWHHRSGVNYKEPLCIGVHTDDAHNIRDDTVLPPSLQCTRAHPPSSFEDQAHETQDIWKVIEPELDRIVKEGTFWKPRLATQQNTGKRPSKKPRTSLSSNSLAQPTIEFFRAKALDATKTPKNADPPHDQGQKEATNTSEASPTRSTPISASESTLKEPNANKRKKPSPSGASPHGKSKDKAQPSLASFFQKRTNG